MGTLLRLPPRPNGISAFGASTREKVRAHLLQRALDVFDFMAAQRRLDEQPHARRGYRTMQEPIDDAGGDLTRDARLFFRRAHDHEHEVRPGFPQALRHDGEIALDEHAVEQTRRHAAAVQVRGELRFRGDEDELVGWIDGTAQQSDQRAVLGNRGDRDGRRGARDIGRLELRLRQHDGVGTSV
jgi:hypothetical protein